jgi:hypothetical protein
MKIMASALALLCIALIGTVSAQCEKEDEDCERLCFGPKTCPSLNCGKSKKCDQVCVNTTCTGMTCSADECTQTCTNCENKMVCSGRNCSQICSGNYCEMECTGDVEYCGQTCQANSTCKVTCNPSEKTTCMLACIGANCTGLPKKPEIVSACDDAQNCSTTCEGTCGDETVTCSDPNAKECRLSCIDGCKMECGENIELCIMTCDGDKPCSRDCKAIKCVYGGKFRDTTNSSTMVCRFNYFLFLLFAFIMLQNDQ